MLRVTTSITSIGRDGLNLEGNELGNEGWGAIFAAICGSEASKIASIDASSKAIGPKGAKLIGQALQNSVNASLTKVSLAKNELGEEGTKIICESMKGNDTLKEIDLSGDSYYGSNIGGAAGAKHVADLLRVTASVTSVRASIGW